MNIKQLVVAIGTALFLCVSSAAADISTGSSVFNVIIHWASLFVITGISLWLCFRLNKMKSTIIDLRKMTLTDELTQLDNRRSLFERAKHEVRVAQIYQRDLTVASCDIDHFKDVNDSYGHQVGDEVLMWVADLLRSTIRGTDFVGRVGGEEFIILLPNTSCADAVTIVNRIRLAMHEHIATEHKIHISMSIGMSCLEPGDGEFSEIVSRADAAMYHAKNNGRDQIIEYSKGMSV